MKKFKKDDMLVGRVYQPSNPKFHDKIYILRYSGIFIKGFNKNGSRNKYFLNNSILDNLPYYFYENELIDIQPDCKLLKLLL